jgi:hypothetical protein
VQFVHGKPCGGCWRPDLVRPCIACNDGCIHQVGQEKGVRCIHNPGAGRELKINERLIGKADVA